MFFLKQKFMHTEFGAPGHVTRISEGENRQKVDKFEPGISVTTNIDEEKRFVVFEHTINHFSFCCVHLPRLK